LYQSNLYGEGRGHIGTDESGKGDFFGPLVTAGVYCPEGQEEVFRELGVRDSKRISDNRIREIAESLREGYPYSIVAIGPEKYNQLYSKFRNLNRLLAWAHARVIENILEKVPCERAVTDQFGDASFVNNALLKLGRRIELIQKTGGEADPAVAAASILARAEFVKRMSFLSREAGLELPKGAAPKVEEAGVRLVEKLGPDALSRFAKIHFKTTRRVLAANRGRA
jgi:ribonuclease HIII